MIDVIFEGYLASPEVVLRFRIGISGHERIRITLGIYLSPIRNRQRNVWMKDKRVKMCEDVLCSVSG